MDKVFVDSSILILAMSSNDADLRRRALEELNRDVEYLFSRIVVLETLPQPTINRYPNQVAFLQTFFRSATRVECGDSVQELALAQACSGAGLHAADALHVACAIRAGATELVTAERARRRLSNAAGVPVRTIRV